MTAELSPSPAEPPQEVSPEELEELMKELMEQFKELVEFKEDSTAEEEVVEDEENPEAELIREVEDETLPPEQKPEEEKPKDQGGDRGDAKGGNPDLDDVEIQRTVVYMANQSGAKFKEPEVKAPAAAEGAAPAADAPAK